MAGRAGTRDFTSRRIWIAHLIGSLALLMALFGTVSLLLSAGQILNRKPGAPDAAVLILYNPAQSVGQYRLLQAGFALAGLASRTVSCPDSSVESLGMLDKALLDLAGEANIPANHVWLVSNGGSAAVTWHLAERLPELAGLMLLSPTGLDPLTAIQIQAWPALRPLVILTGERQAGAPDAGGRLIFEYLTGEDALLLPGYRAAGLGRPTQYTSVSGLVHLAVYPVLPGSLALNSPRLVPDAVRWLGEWSSLTAVPGKTALPARQIVDLIFQLALAGLLLLAIPPALSLALSSRSLSRPNDMQSDGQPSRRRLSAGWWAEILLWLPAAIPAAGLGFLAGLIAGRPGRWLFYFLILWPGCRGWLFVLIRRLGQNGLHRPSDRLTDLPSDRQADRPTKQVVSALLPIMAGLVLLTGFVLLVGWWLNQFFGLFRSAAFPWLLLLLLVLISFPAGLAGTSGRIGAAMQEDQSGQPFWLNSLWQYLPFLILPFWTAIALGWASLPASLLLLMAALWSVSFGKAVALLTKMTHLGSLAQAAVFSIGVLMPPILAGLSLAG